MAWTDPATLSTGHIVTAAEWATYVTDNLEYLRVQGGGAVSIPTVETRLNSAFGLLTTPDRVQNVVVPANAIVHVGYQALWKEANIGVARAAIFIDSNNVKIGRPAASTPDDQMASIGGTANLYVPLASYGGGLVSATAATTDTSEVTTGQLIGVQESGERRGGTAQIGMLAAGTYTISVQFKSTDASTVTVKNRHLWVWVQPFSL
jgi:hypothetical protein